MSLKMPEANEIKLGAYQKSGLFSTIPNFYTPFNNYVMGACCVPDIELRAGNSATRQTRSLPSRTPCHWQ